MKKIRGFEKISLEQYSRDFFKKEIEEVNEEDLLVTYNKIKIPQRATSFSAAYDIFSPFSFTLEPGEDIKLPTGIKSYMMGDEALLVYVRSGHGFKHYLRLANSTGVIDSDYYNNENNEGHIWVKIRNEGKLLFSVDANEAIAQCIFTKYLLADNESGTKRVRKGGFGHTSK